MFSSRERPEMRGPEHEMRLRLPAEIVRALNKEAERRAGIIETVSQARSRYAASLLADALARRGLTEQPLQPVATQALHTR